MTANSKINLEIRFAGISPRQLPNPIVKQFTIQELYIGGDKRCKKGK